MKLSRTEQKRRIKEIEKLVISMAALSAPVIDTAPCSEESKELLKEVSSLKGGARKRHLKYITKLMRNDDLDDLYDFLAERKGAVLSEKKQHHETEYQRDTLLNEAIEQKQTCLENEIEWVEQWGSKTVEDICRELSGVDPILLHRLSYLFVQTRNPRHSREIYRYLFALKEQQRIG